ncbi:thermonuclease family protein [Candidatus Woesearchaeota archaeon]|nr:thermonuclease family protein [Candidatus Woesearchaeota archaeon]
MKTLVCIILLLFLLLSSCTTQSLVTRVIDGDTLVLESGEKVRLVCINTPEKDQPGYEEAKQFLNKLTLNKEVRLEKDITNKDKYGRLLRYIYVGDTFVNREIVQQGYGKIFRYEPDIKRCGEIET